MHPKFDSLNLIAAEEDIDLESFGKKKKKKKVTIEDDEDGGGEKDDGAVDGKWDVDWLCWKIADVWEIRKWHLCA